ncbi:MAG TPA: IS1182 family transposase, partial [Acidimicrobiales bacterium]|nr:IS1182 family transposase [Acidimicrobiales bacterium]
SVPADVIAATLVLQALEGLSDRYAADALRQNIAWKVAAGLAIDAPGIHPTVLTYWRNRLRQSDRPERIFDAVRDVVSATGILKGRARRALDSTVLDDAVATQDTVTQLIAAIRRVLRVVPAAGDATLARDYSTPAKPNIAWDDPAAKAGLVTELVNDALTIIATLEGEVLDDEAADAVGLLALVAGQDVEPGDEPGTWRIAERVAPDRVVSVVDPESRHVHKTVHDYRDGYKAHAAAEPETGLITDVAITPGNTPDAETALDLLAGETEPVDVLGDSAYGSGKLRAKLNALGHGATIKPIPLRSAVPGGFTTDDFTLDTENSTVTCPAGHTVALTRKLNATFGKLCAGCPLRTQCTTAKDGRTLKVHPYDPELRAARAAAKDPDFALRYRTLRPMIERTLAWLVANNNRRLRYRGVERNQLWLTHRAAALNLRRLLNLGLQHDDGGWAIA